MDLLRLVWFFLRGLWLSRSAAAVEIVALRHQLLVLKRSVKRPRWRARDRLFWVGLSRLWPNWRSVLAIAQPATVIKWHRWGFKRYWRWKSWLGKRKVGRPPIAPEVRALIRRMSLENITWGAPRIQSELALLGHEVCERTVAKYMVRHRKPFSQTWRTFLDNHLRDLVATDFFVVPTIGFRLLYCMVVMRHDRRQVVHFNVTEHPSARWAAQQIVEAFPYEEAPRYLLRDRDEIFGPYFQKRAASMGIEEVPTAPQSPWQNPYCERLIGSIRRECLDHVIVLSEAHLYRILKAYFAYYHRCRTHLSLERNPPIPREVELPSAGPVKSIPQMGGLHHRYTRAA